MCNLYDIGPSRTRARTAFEAAALERLLDLPKLTGIRKTDTGLVVRRQESAYVGETMRWGFERPFNPAINNTRADKLDSRMWNEAFRARRCLIPVAAFYEWTGPKGAKQTHLIRSPEPDHWLWCAGLWEPNRELGSCYSMITLEAPPWMTAIHSRMIALFDDLETAGAFIETDDPFPLLQPPAPLAVVPCDNPLTRASPAPERPVQLAMDGILTSGSTSAS